MLKAIREFSDETRQLAAILAGFDRRARVLDVGCGFGRNLDLLRRLNFETVVGVEKNPQLIELNRRRGVACLSPEEARRQSERYDLLLMSHIIEHFEHAGLQAFIESYLDLLAEGGHLLIVTPLLHRCFYNDFDHVKPYYPIGMAMVFGEEVSQVQVQSDRTLRLEDLRFYRDQFRLQFHRGLFLPHAGSWPRQVNRALKLLFFVSGGRLGQKIGWIGLYRYLGRRRAG